MDNRWTSPEEVCLWEVITLASDAVATLRAKPGARFLVLFKTRVAQTNY